MLVFKEEDFLEYASIKDVYTYCNHYDLFRYYIGDFKLGKPIISPLQAENNPSFAVFASGGQVYYNDFRLGGGDIVEFVKIRYNLSFQEAINKVIYDSGLSTKFKTELSYDFKPVLRHDHKIVDSKPIIQIKGRKGRLFDINFWKQYGITKEILNKYKVTPLSHMFINGKVIKTDKYAYAFKEFKDNEHTYTIYQPYSDKYKWIKSHDHSIFYGWEQLPNKGDTLILTKSLKDIMSIVSITGLPAVALQSEKVIPKPQVIQQLKDRFTNIYLLYDNDWNKEINYGREFGKKIAKEFDLIQIEIPDLITEKYEAKDISDLAKYAGIDYVKTMLLDDIKNYKI